LEVCYPFVTNFGAKVNKKIEKEKEFMTFCLLIPSVSINLYIFQLRFMPFAYTLRSYRLLSEQSVSYGQVGREKL
jgi:hypothetical protein